MEMIYILKNKFRIVSASLFSLSVRFVDSSIRSFLSIDYSTRLS
jgi:hypothetical protein